MAYALLMFTGLFLNLGQKMKSKRVSQFSTGSVVGFALLANLFLFLPMTLFLGNNQEFSVPFDAILAYFFLPAITLLVIVALVSMLLPFRAFRVFTAILATLSLLVWAQGNLLVWDYGVLNGTSIPWEKNQIFGWLELTLWSLAIVFVVGKVAQVGSTVVGIAISLAALQFGLFGYHYLSDSSELQKGIDTSFEVASAKNIFRFSPSDNIVHIIADGFQADIIDELLTTDESARQLSEALVGFTSFRQHLGVFPYTHMSIPAIFSGEVYENHMPINEFHKTSLGDNSIITLAKQNGYQIDLAIPRGALTNIYEKVNPDNRYPVNNGPDLMHDAIIGKDATRLFDLSLFRALPHHVKRLIYNNQQWLTQNLSKKTVLGALQNFAHMSFLSEAAGQMTTDRETPVYKLFHLMLSHNPMVTTRDCRSAGGVLITNRENVLAQSRCGLQRLVVFLDAMKASGIYDSSTIVIMGDHGAWVPPTGMEGVESAVNENDQRLHPALTALATPFFAVKPPHQQHPLIISDAHSSITDTAKTIANINGFQNTFKGSSVFDLPPTAIRDRRYMYYQYSRSEWTDSRLSDIEEFRVSGEAVDSASWTSLNIYRSNGDVEKTKPKGVVWMNLTELHE